MAAKRGRVIVKPVADGLTAIGIDPEQVQDVIISHLHYDHCGNHDLFPRGEVSPAGSRDGLRHRTMHVSRASAIPFEADDVVAMVRKVFDGRVAFHDGDEQLAPA
jgi:glyoxylase-like metal-dependent hydrolase (beta-lactamase superfamily II)